jgi:hypothetical protein
MLFMNNGVSEFHTSEGAGDEYAFVKRLRVSQTAGMVIGTAAWLLVRGTDDLERSLKQHAGKIPRSTNLSPTAVDVMANPISIRKMPYGWPILFGDTILGAELSHSSFGQFRPQSFSPDFGLHGVRQLERDAVDPRRRR